MNTPAQNLLSADQTFEWGGLDPIANGIWFVQDGANTILCGDTDRDVNTAEFMLTLENNLELTVYTSAASDPPMTWLML